MKKENKIFPPPQTLPSSSAEDMPRPVTGCFGNLDCGFCNVSGGEQREARSSWWADRKPTMWHAHNGMNIVDPRAELAMRTGYGGLEISHVRTLICLGQPEPQPQTALHARAELRGRLAGGVHARVPSRPDVQRLRDSRRTLLLQARLGHAGRAAGSYGERLRP